MSPKLPSVQHVAVGTVGVGTLWWTQPGALTQPQGVETYLTICAKTSLRMAHGADMTLVDPDPMRRDEKRDSPTASVNAPNDVLPRLLCPEITLSGSAHARAGEARKQSVRLVVTRDGATVLDKRLEVLGDRDANGEPQPFKRMPLTYERALGGIGFAANPLGRGVGDGERPPNVLDPKSPDTVVAGYAPLPAAFAVRKKRLGALTARELTRERLEIPAGFDWRFFQSAPDDQQVASLGGNEWVWLEGMSAERQHFRSRLPDVRAAARLYGVAGSQLPDYVPLRAESLHVDADRGLCHLVWRGCCQFASTGPSLIVAVGLSIAGAAIVWPASSEELAQLLVAQSEWLPDDQLLEQDGNTIIISNADGSSPDLTTTAAPRVFESPTMPFVGERPSRSSAPPGDIPGAPWARKVEDRPVPVNLASQTLDPDEHLEALAAGQRAIAERLDDDRRRAEERAAAERAEAERVEVDRLEAERAAAEAEAEARRKAEADRFAAEQEEARNREAAKRDEKNKAAEKLLNDLYGAFKR